MLSLRNVKAYYQAPTGVVKAVDGVSLDVLDDEILGIAGESGCGKSTLIKVMYGALQRPLQVVSGEIEARVTDEEGHKIVVKTADMRTIWWRQISYVPQGSMNVLNPIMRIERQFMDSVPRSYHGSAVTRQRLVDYLKELNLPPTVLQSYPHQLSGGMRQRVTIALATFLNPSIVLTDEPTTALDVVVQKGILDLLTRLQRKMKNSVVIVSHDMGVHYQITHRLAIMYAGKVVEVGATERIFSQPSHPYTKMLIQSLPHVGDKQMRIGIAGAPPSLLNPPLGCRFAARCPSAQPICREKEPALIKIENNVEVACHLFSANGSGAQARD